MFFKPDIIWRAAQGSSSIAWRNYTAPAATSDAAHDLQLCMRKSYLFKYCITRSMQAPVRFRNNFSPSPLWSSKTLVRFWIFFSFRVLKFQKLSTARAKAAREVTQPSDMVLGSTTVSLSRLKCPANDQVRYLTSADKNFASLFYFAYSAALASRII